MPDRTLFLCNGAAQVAGDWERIERLDWRGPDAIINMRPETLAVFMGADVPNRMRDLIEVSAYVYAADAMISRGGPVGAEAGQAWRRSMHFVIAVRDIEFWQQPAIGDELTRMLSFLSEDDCRFTFTYRPFDEGKGKQASFGFGPGVHPSEVVLFSGGLDSLAGAIDLLAADRSIVLASHVSSEVTGSTQTRLFDKLRDQFKPSRVARVPFKLNLKTGVTVESSHRTRSLLFATLGGAIANASGLSRISFFENGVISLNLPIAGAVVGARATRTTHPRVLRFFRWLLGEVAGRPFEVVNPFFWKTKTEIVSEIASNGLPELIGLARSCAKVQAATTMHPHCGVCTQCVDRRFATLASGLAGHDPAVDYSIDLLTGERPEVDQRTVALAYLETALKFKDMDAVQFVSAFPQVHQALSHLDLPIDAAASRIFDLHKRHGETVHRVVRQALQSHGDALAAKTLPQTCLLRLALGAGDADLKAASPPPATPLPQALTRLFNMAVKAQTSGKAIVGIEGVGEWKGKRGQFLARLTEHFREDTSAGRKPENFRGAPSRQLEKALGHESNEALRKLVERLRKNLIQRAADNGIVLANETIIETLKDGYRLNPSSIRLVDPSQIEWN